MTTMQQLIDRQEITDLVVGLGYWLDGRSGDPRDVYDAEVVARSPRGEFHGIDEVLALVGRSARPDEHVQHFHTDVLVDHEGDRATVRANQLVQFYRHREPPHRTSGLRVQYEMARRPGGWRIVTADIDLQWLVGDLPT